MTDTDTAVNAAEKAAFLERLRAYEGRSVGAPEPADDPVNVPMIRHWVEAMGVTDPVHLDDEAARTAGREGVVAPATMLQVWTMKGLKAQHGRPDNLQTELLGMLDEAGFTSVVATNTDQDYLRELVPGDHLSATSSIESVSEEKTTGLGVGHFVTTRTEFHDQHGELVGTMTFRILKFKPAARKAESAEADGDERPPRPRPSINRDNAFWFEGAKAHQLLIQRCTGCETLRHPPGPACPSCRSFDWDAVEASGRGTVYSFTVNHYPKVPAFDYPLAVGLIELEEGVRVVANIVDIAPDAIEIGAPVEVVFTDFDDELTLPQFRPVAAGGDA
jgi:uncharacterized OB-fold protein/acyl dehydratase